MELVIVDRISFSGLNHVFKLIDNFLQSIYNLTSRCDSYQAGHFINLLYLQHFFEILLLLYIF